MADSGGGRALLGGALVLACGPASGLHEPDAETSTAASSSSSGDEPLPPETGSPDAGPTAPCEPVIFADPDLEIAVRMALEIDAFEPLTVERLTSLTEVNAHSAGIEDLRGIECAPALEHLVVPSSEYGMGEPNAIADLAPVAAMVSLVRIEVGYNAITGLVPLPHAESLDASGNPLASIAGIVGSDIMWVLKIDDTQVADLSPATELPALRAISADRSAVTDLSGLAGSPTLESLSILETAVSDLSVADDLPALRSLYIDGTPISDLSVLEDRELYSIEARSIAIAGLPENLWVEYSEFSSNGITDLTPLLGWTLPVQIGLGDNEIDDVTPLLSFDPDDCVSIDLEGNPLGSPDVAAVLQQVCAERLVQIFAGAELSCQHEDCPLEPPG